MRRPSSSISLPCREHQRIAECIAPVFNHRVVRHIHLVARINIPLARNTLARQLQPLGSLGLTWCCWSRSESIGQYAQGKRERLCAKTAGAFIRNDDVEISQHEGEGGRHAAKTEYQNSSKFRVISIFQKRILINQLHKKDRIRFL